MDEMRKAFEAWATAAPRGWGARRYMSSEMPWPGEYQEYRVQCAWEAWQDACAAEREACAIVCRERAERFESAAQRADARGAHDEAVSLRATEWQLTVCANKIEKRSQQ